MSERTDTQRRRFGPADDDPIEATDPLAMAVARLQDAPPSSDLWPGIAARLTPQAKAPRVVSFTLPQLAMAATLLIAVSGGVSWLAFSRPAAPAAPEPAIQAVAEPREAAQPDIAPATFADAQYDAAVADLEQILRDDSQRLDPLTVMVIERNLRAIDEAIREARAALDADPANTYLNSHLAEARRRKLELLRRAAGLSTTGG